MTNQVYSSVMKAAAFAAGLAIGLVCSPVFAAPASGGETVQGLYDALLNTMKNARAGPKRPRWSTCRLLMDRKTPPRRRVR